MLDKIVGSFAPFYCLSCEQIGHILCEVCIDNVLEHAPSRCYRCHKVTSQSAVCTDCRHVTRLKHVWVVAYYEGLAKDIVELLKFERAMFASRDIAQAMADKLPMLSEQTIICHVPTAFSRQRVRGYDQSKLIAKHLAKLVDLPYRSLINRTNNSRQVGSSRKQRFLQAAEAFELNKTDIKAKNILIVDDVTTTGATLEILARLFKQAGAKSVDAIVFAQA